MVFRQWWCALAEVPEYHPADSQQKNDQIAEASEQAANAFELAWQPVVEEYKRRGEEIPEFDRTTVRKLRLQDDI